MSRLHIMVLHRYHNSVTAPMPDRLRAIMLAAGTTTLEMAVALETIPDLRPWSWYGGAYQQYHTAFLLLMEVYIYPQRKEADRIWTCLDYIFETEASLPRREKGKKILSELQQKTAVYQSMRGMRAPVVMQKHVGQREPRVADTNVMKDLKFMAPEQERTSTHEPKSELDREPEQEHTSSLVGFQSFGTFGPPMPQSLPGIGHSIGRAPLGQDMQFAGVSNGESLWAFPNSSQSPEASSDTTSLAGQHMAGVSGNGIVGGGMAQNLGQQDDLMADIDWVRNSRLPQLLHDFLSSSFMRSLLLDCE